MNALEQIKELTDVKKIFTWINYGFSEGHEQMKGFTEYDIYTETILQFVKDTSKGFQSDVAEKALKYGNPSEKQSWAIAFEFLKIKSDFDLWAQIKGARFGDNS